MIELICTTIEEPDNREYMLWLYREYRRLMYSVAYKFTTDTDNADDIVQESVLNLIKKVDTIRPMKRYVLASYIVATVRNTSINLLKSQAREAENRADYIDEVCFPEMPLDKLMILAENRYSLVKIWKCLSEDDRFLLEGKYVLGYTDHELASQQQCKASSIRMKLTRARRNALSLLIEEGIDRYDKA